MTEIQFQIVDELYFVVSFEELKSNLEITEDTLLKELHKLFQKGWLRVFPSPDDTMDYEEVTDNILINSYLLASKEGLKAHNS